MVKKKLFALASVTALGGFVAAIHNAGCSSSETTNQPRDSGVVDAKKDVQRPPPPPADTAEPESCKSKVPFKPDTVKPPAAQSATACNDKTISALATDCVDDPNSDKCKTARADNANKTCADCIFGSPSDDQWKVINLMPGQQPSARYNQEGCVEHITGVKGCGVQYLQVLGCFNDLCGDCSSGEMKSCLDEVAKGECLQYRIADQTCGNAIAVNQNAINGCFPTTTDLPAIATLFTYMAKVSCATAPGEQADAGDAGE